MKLTAETGKIVAGENHVTIPPANYAPGGTYRLLVGLHGAGASAFGETAMLRSNYMLRAQAFSNAGFYQLWIDGGSANLSSWGNDTSIAALASAWAWAKATLPIKTDKFVTYGNSAGNVWALNYAVRNPSDIKAHAGTLPVVDIQDIHDNNRQGLGAGIETAANGSTPSTIADSWYASHSPVRQISSLTTLPQRFWYSGTDSVALTSVLLNYIASVGSTASATTFGNYDHSISGSSPYGVVSLTDIAAWLAVYI